MIRLNARNLLTKTDAHPYLKEMLSFPDYYGNNLDALFDCLTDLGPTRVCIENVKIGGSYLNKILRVFRDAQKANPDLELEILQEEGGLKEETAALNEAENIPEEPEDAPEEPEDAPEEPEDAPEEPEEFSEDLAPWDEDQDDLRLLDGADGMDE